VSEARRELCFEIPESYDRRQHQQKYERKYDNINSNSLHFNAISTANPAANRNSWAFDVNCYTTSTML